MMPAVRCRFDVVTLFPELVEGVLRHSVLGRAVEQGLIEVALHQLRNYATDKHRTVDDRPFGGGPGMLLKCEPVVAAVESVRAMDAEPARVVLLGPAGRVFDQAMAREWSGGGRRILLCGHYEGFDHRIREHVAEEEVSLGDYILSNGALAAAVMIDAVARLVPGALGNEQSPEEESFSEGLLEAPHYTRPVDFRGWRVPEILLSGHHGEIAAWRKQQSLLKTRAFRPDLLKRKED
jgi:tRNA (guanine37-N1)-methyltransferase